MNWLAQRMGEFSSWERENSWGHPLRDTGGVVLAVLGTFRCPQTPSTKTPHRPGPRGSDSGQVIQVQVKRVLGLGVARYCTGYESDVPSIDFSLSKKSTLEPRGARSFRQSTTPIKKLGWVRQGLTAWFRVEQNACSAASPALGSAWARRFTKALPTTTPSAPQDCS